MAAIAIRSLAAQMLCGLALTANPWQIFSLILTGWHRAIPNCDQMDGKIEPNCDVACEGNNQSAAMSRIPWRIFTIAQMARFMREFVAELWIVNILP